MSQSRFRELTRSLSDVLVSPGGLFRLHYGLRNPAVGRGLGLDGVEDLAIIERYASALDRVHELYNGWDWPTPVRDAEGTVPAYVFRTERLGLGDCPLTIPVRLSGGVLASKLALRSVFDEPRHESRLERAEVEAAHEASHVFTHQFVPLTAAVAPLWRWFDEATAVFMESEAFPNHVESLRFGLHWNHCPEMALTTWGGVGGYFAAWFVRFLVQKQGPGLLLEAWRSGAAGRSGPLDALDRALKNRGTSLTERFWDYTRQSFDARRIDPRLVDAFGPRSITETFAGPSAEGPADPLSPLACRFYRIAWETSDDALAVQVIGDPELGPSELRAAVLTVDGVDRIEGTTALEPAQGAPTTLRGTASRPEDGRRTILVVARVEPPALPSAIKPASIRVRIGPARDRQGRQADDEPEGEVHLDDAAARETAFLGTRYATVAPRDDDPESSAAGTDAPPEHPADFRVRTASEYRRRSPRS